MTIQIYSGQHTTWNLSVLFYPIKAHVRARMTIHPIDSRYGTPEMRTIWTNEFRISAMLQVEAALAQAESKVGLIPETTAKKIKESLPAVTPKRIEEIELETGHEVMAMVKALSEVSGDDGRWVHFGAASNDILDTAFGLQLKESISLIEKKLRNGIDILLQRAHEWDSVICIARTHGQHALPITYGLRAAVWATELARHLERIENLKPRIFVGKMNGATGTMAALSSAGPAVQQMTMDILGLKPVMVSTQVIGRDRYAEYVFVLANIATTLDKIAIELRTLQRTEIGEVEEPHRKQQIGSSAMPHKQNPVMSEQICGLARIIRGMIEPALLNNTLWDERDLTNSSAERIIYPEISLLTDHCLSVFTKVITGLTLNPAAIEHNLLLTNDANLAESIITALTKKGLKRIQAYEILHEDCFKCKQEKESLKNILMNDSRINTYLTSTEINELLDFHQYIGLAKEEVDTVIKTLQNLSYKKR